MVSLTEIGHDDGVCTVQIGNVGCGDGDPSCEIVSGSGEVIHNGERNVECSELGTNCVVTESEVMDIHIRFSDGEIVEIVKKIFRDGEIVTKAYHVEKVNGSENMEDTESVEAEVEIQTMKETDEVMVNVDDEQPFVEDEVKEAPAIDLTRLDIDFQFDSFGHPSDTECVLEGANPEPIPTCEGVDDIDDGQGDGQRVGVSVNVETYSSLVKLNEQIRNAQLQLDEKIRCKDAIAAEMVKDEIDSTINEEEHMGSPDEIKHALEQKDQMEEHLEDLKNELKTLKDDASKAEVACDTITKKYIEEHDMERELRARFIAAGESCKEASGNLNSLKNEERFMEEWNSNEEFRKDYISRHNILATPNAQDEPSRVFTDDTDQKVASNLGPTPDEIKSASVVTNLETQKVGKSLKEKHSDDQVKESVLEEFEQIMKNKESIKEKEKTNDLIKEKTRLEEKVKANETHEKAQTGGEIQAQKKEKARLKRLRKREKKRAGRDAASSSIDDRDVVGSNKSKEIESTNEKSQQHPPPPRFLSKQLKPKFIPPPPAVAVAIRNRQRWRLWGNMVITVMVMILCVFFF
ncbi:hypothetical protein L1987_42876 [Smallanthus sonchifolius]|uniref:Uncharacterized protein n=1 Tax=Smallanthus sonchifolius TaxID=185202 RepID=A0ACB9GJJ4_9ASTR|nr:hypothetical protein L1987_42876 [Smallanthus sonchifolius]